MKFTTGFSLAFCLLILTGLQSCSPKSDSGQVTRAEQAPALEDIDQTKLTELIKTSERDFILVNFFATWCKPCKVELPDLVEINQDPNSNVKVIFISLDEKDVTDEKLASFLQDYGVGVRSYRKSQGEETFIRQLYPEWRKTIPLNLVYDKEGNLLEAMGLTDKSEVEMIVTRHETI